MPTFQKQTERQIVSILRENGGYMLNEDISAALHDLTDGQVESALGRMLTEGTVVRKFTNERYSLYALNLMYFGSSSINRLWRK